MDGPNKFTFTVPEVGEFTARKRTMALQARIQQRAADILGTDDSSFQKIRDMANAVATLEILVERAPEGFVLDDLDPAVEEDWEQMSNVVRALLAEEARFRGRPDPTRQGEGASAKPDA